MTISYQDSAITWVVHFLLITSRISAMFILSPILGRANIPQAAKVGFSILMAFIMISLHPAPADYPFESVWTLAVAVLLELLIGFIIGFGTILFFDVVYTAGQIIDMQVGFSMLQVYDVSAGAQVPIAGTILNLVFVECFLLSDGLTTLISILAQTFYAIPVGAVSFPPEIMEVALESFSKSFVLSLNVCMPVLASALLAEIALGVIVRTAPQMNVFVIGVPIKVILGLVMLAAMVPVFVQATQGLFDLMYDTIDELLVTMMPKT